MMGHDLMGRRRILVLPGFVVGALIGLAIVYPMVSALDRKLESSEKVATSKSSDQSSQSCEALDDRIVRLGDLIVRRQRERAILGAFLAVMGNPEYSPAADRAVGSSYKNAKNRASLRKIYSTWQYDKQRQASLWDAFSEARQVDAACKQGDAVARRTKGDTERRNVGRSSPENSEKLVRSVIDRLDNVFGERRKFLDVLTSVNTAADLLHDPLPAVPNSLPRELQGAAYVDWLDLAVYAVGEARLFSGAENENLTEVRRAAMESARRRLFQGVMHIGIGEAEKVEGLARNNGELMQQLRLLLEASEVRMLETAENGVRRVVLRIPITGSDGLLPKIIPYGVARTQAIQKKPPSPGDEPPVQRDEIVSGVVLDARWHAIDPVLLPRILSQSGETVLDISMMDPNEVAERGLCVYTPYEGSVPYYVGDRPLWINVTDSKSEGIIIVDDASASELRSVLRDGRTKSLRLAVLTDWE